MSQNVKIQYEPKNGEFALRANLTFYAALPNSNVLYIRTEYKEKYKIVDDLEQISFLFNILHTQWQLFFLSRNITTQSE